MKILVINDDSIRSAGLWAAVRALRRVGEVVVVAPAREQSGRWRFADAALAGKSNAVDAGARVHGKRRRPAPGYGLGRRRHPRRLLHTGAGNVDHRR